MPRWSHIHCEKATNLTVENVQSQSLKSQLISSFGRSLPSCIAICLLMFFLRCLAPHTSQVVCWWQDWTCSLRHLELLNIFMQPGSAHSASMESSLTAIAKKLIRHLNIFWSTMLGQYINGPWESSCFCSFDGYLKAFPHPASWHTHRCWHSAVDAWFSSCCSSMCLFMSFRVTNSRLQFSTEHLNWFSSLWLRRWRVKWSFLL